MKKSTTILSLVSVIMFLVMSGFVLNKSLTEAGSNDDISVDPFNRVSLSISAKMYIEQGSPQKLVIDADQSVLDKIEATVENKNLIIKLKNRGDRLRGDVTIHITVPELESLAVAGSGDVMVGKTFNSEELKLKIAGSGKISFSDLQSREVDAKISGSGTLELGGQAKEFDVSLAGSGDVKALDFVVDEFDGKISGSGNCRVNVTGDLGASIAGSGDIIYKGNPKVRSTVAGSGSVRPAK